MMSPTAVVTSGNANGLSVSPRLRIVTERYFVRNGSRCISTLEPTRWTIQESAIPGRAETLVFPGARARDHGTITPVQDAAREGPDHTVGRGVR
jgi:hypothetical protein